MGSLVDKVTGSGLSGFAGIAAAGLDPTSGIALGLSDPGSASSYVADPLDLFGTRASADNEAIQNILTQSAESGIALNEAQLAQIEALTAPFRDASTNTALPTLSSFALGGDTGYTQSDLLTRQLASGREGILESRSAGSGVKSSGTFEDLASLASTLSAEDVSRYEQSNTDLLNTGLRAEEVLRQTGTSLGGTVGNIFGNLGTGLNTASQNLAQSQTTSANTLANGVSSLSRLAELGDN